MSGSGGQFGGIHNQLFGVGADSAAALFAQVEIQAGIAKANYDDWAKKKAADASVTAHGVVARSRLDLISEQNPEDSGTGDRFERYRRPNVGGPSALPRPYFWAYNLSKAKTVMQDLVELLELPSLPPPSKPGNAAGATPDTTTAEDLPARPAPATTSTRKMPQDPEDLAQVPELRVSGLDYTNLSPVVVALKTNTTFSVVDLSGNRLDADSAAELAALLLTNTTLTALDLSQNELTNEGVAALAAALGQQGCTLASLSLAMTSIGYQGGKAVAAMLRQNSTLTRLSLNGNDKLGARTAEEVAQSLEANTTLRSLGLANTGCGPSGAEALLELLGKNPTLTEVDLEANKVDLALLTAVQAKTQANYDAWFPQALARHLE
eukprot:RCo047253